MADSKYQPPLFPVGIRKNESGASWMVDKDGTTVFFPNGVEYLLDLIGRFAHAYDHDGGRGNSSEFQMYADWLAKQGRLINEFQSRH